MKTLVLTTFSAAAVVVGLPPLVSTVSLDTRLTADQLAYVMGGSGTPTPNAAEVAAVQQLYLDPNGFDGTAVALTTPEQFSDQSYLDGEQDLINAVQTAYANGQISAEDPLYIFGYSQSAAIASAAESQLYAAGIPSEDLHFVLVGDSASAHGGFFNTFPSLMSLFGYPHEAGLITPDQYYPTDVYTITGDNWADAANAFFGIPSLASFQHLEYYGLTSQEVASATLAHTDGLTDYYTISDSAINQLSALWESFLISLGFG